MPPVDLAIFDLDGTLVDTLPDIAAALTAALADVGVPPPPLDVVKQLVGDGTRALIQRAISLARVERHVDPLLARYLAHYRAHVSDRSVIYDGVPDALAALAAAGVATAVITNKPSDIARRLLADLGLAHHFRAVIGDGDGYPRKPDPAAARAVISMVGTQPDRTVIIGDGVPDMQMAHATGARAIATTWGYVPRDRLATESPDVLAGTVTDALTAILSPLPLGEG